MEGMGRLVLDLSFYKGKRVLVTGHTGFKGSWLCTVLLQVGAIVAGYSLNPPTDPNLFDLCGVEKKIKHYVGDICDFTELQKTFQAFQPEIVFHLAAQPIVREAYEKPVYTYETNVMGTVYLCECIRKSNSVKSFLNITTDKVYQNQEWEWGYRENDPLDGHDPYSNSKSCSELVTHSYKKSFFNDIGIAVSTARAGNVIGGGDFARDRIIPDCIRAALNHERVIVRNPSSTRPYQHVLEPLMAYLMIAKEQYCDDIYAGSYNVGPDDKDCISTGELVEYFCRSWGEGMAWESKNLAGPYEANYLKLDCSKLKKTFGWMPRWGVEKALDKTIEWTRVWLSGQDIERCMKEQIEEFLREK